MNSDQIIVEDFIFNHPLDATRILERMSINETSEFLKSLPVSLSVNIIKQMESAKVAKCLEMLPFELSVDIIEKLPLEIVAIFLRQIKSEKREEILAKISDEIAEPLRSILLYPENSAGALADPLVLSLPEDITVKDALNRVQDRPEKAIYYLYVVNRERALKGVINLRELMLANPAAHLSAVMQTNVAVLPAAFNFQAILNHPAWQNYHALPVSTESGIFLGVIRYETLRIIENAVKNIRLPRQVIAAGNALGELFKIGLSGLLQSATTQFRGQSQED